MVNIADKTNFAFSVFIKVFLVCLLLNVNIAFAQDGSLLTSLENSIRASTRGWQQTVMGAASSLFWILAGIEFGIAAVWLAIAVPSLDAWAAELIRRVMFIGFFLFALQQGPAFSKAIVDSLFALGADGGTASPADVFNAGIKVASKLSEHVRFGVFEDNAMAIGIVISMIVVVICFSLVAAIFVSALVEMYVGLLAGMIMLGLGGSSFTKDFAIKYFVYAFSVGMKLMSLVMIARIGAGILIGLSGSTDVGEQLLTSLVIAGLSVVVFMIAIQVPNIIQGVVAGASVSNGMETMRSTAHVSAFAASTYAGLGAGIQAAASARAAGASLTGQVLAGARASGGALAGTAAKAAMGSHGSDVGGASRSMGLRNRKTTQK